MHAFNAADKNLQVWRHSNVKILMLDITTYPTMKRVRQFASRSGRLALLSNSISAPTVAKPSAAPVKTP